MSQMPEDFLNAYIEAAFWSSIHETENSDSEPCPDPNCDQEGENLDETEHELSDEGREKMRADCEKFWAENHEDLAFAFQAISGPTWSWQEGGGHDFWLTRNHHGVGFWDRKWKQPQAVQYALDRLTEACDKFGECDLYVGDDGKVYVS